MTNKLNKVLFGACLTLACSCASWSSSSSVLSLHSTDVDQLYAGLSAKQNITSEFKGIQDFSFEFNADQLEKFPPVFNGILQQASPKPRKIVIFGNCLPEQIENPYGGPYDQSKFGEFFKKLNFKGLPEGLELVLSFEFGKEGKAEQMLRTKAAYAITSLVSELPAQAKLFLNTTLTKFDFDVVTGTIQKGVERPDIPTFRNEKGETLKVDYDFPEETIQKYFGPELISVEIDLNDIVNRQKSVAPMLELLKTKYGMTVSIMFKITHNDGSITEMKDQTNTGLPGPGWTIQEDAHWNDITPRPDLTIGPLSGTRHPLK